MTDEKFKLGIKIVGFVAVLLLICEVLIAVGVIRRKNVSTSVLDEIEKDVSDSELLHKQDLNEIDMDDYYIEE